MGEWILLPREPTEEMVVAASGDDFLTDYQESAIRARVVDVWKDMIASSPPISEEMVGMISRIIDPVVFTFGDLVGFWQERQAEAIAKAREIAALLSLRGNQGHSSSVASRGGSPPAAAKSDGAEGH